jgi:hypothetical protein
MSIRAATQAGTEAGTIQCVLTFPVEILDRVNRAEQTLGEQLGAVMRDRLLSALAAMVIASIDEYRMGPIFSAQSDDRRIEAEKQDIIASGEVPEIGTGDEPLDFGGRVK